MPDKFDIAVLGGGPGGYVAAIRAAQMGAKVCCIEEDKLGGVCLNWGCIPTKTFIATAHLFKKIKEAHEFGINLAGTPQIDLPKMVERKNKVVDELVSGIGFLFKSHGVTHFKGFGYFENKNTLIVEDDEGNATKVQADKILIATGSRPMNIPAFPFNGSTIISSDELIYPKSIPQTLTIIGGGVIGCEFACLLSELGTQVNIVEMLPHALPLEDIDTSKTMERELKKKGVKLHLGQKVQSVEVTGSGAVAKLENGEEIKSERVLVSIGRSFNSEDINLDSVGVKLNKNGSIATNDSMQTSTDNIYAIGDVAGKYLLAYTAGHEGIVAVQHALGKKVKANYLGVPITIFTDPEVGSVGLTEQKVQEQGTEYLVGNFNFRVLGKSKAERDLAGGVKIIADKKSDKILGAHIVGAHATDLVHECAVAIHQGMTATALGDVIHAHPVLSEAIMEALHDVHGLSVHAPKKKM